LILNDTRSILFPENYKTFEYYIVIPAHNEQFISLTLESLVKQTLLPKKVVIVNDNSTDNTADIVLAFAKEHPFVI
jgi:glycosyltransferase involved in cell wall biosynthesis